MHESVATQTQELLEDISRLAVIFGGVQGEQGLYIEADNTFYPIKENLPTEDLKILIKSCTLSQTELAFYLEEYDSTTDRKYYVEMDSMHLLKVINILGHNVTSR